MTSSPHATPHTTVELAEALCASWTPTALSEARLGISMRGMITEQLAINHPGGLLTPTHDELDTGPRAGKAMAFPAEKAA